MQVITNTKMEKKKYCNKSEGLQRKWQMNEAMKGRRSVRCDAGGEAAAHKGGRGREGRGGGRRKLKRSGGNGGEK